MLARLSHLTASARVVFLLAWIALAAAGASWAIATPLSGSPDEPSHLIKAASVVRGEFIGEPGPDASRKIVNVPVGIAQAWNWACFAHDAELSASCVETPVSGLELVEAETSAGLYNPLYYAVVGLPTLVIADTVADVLTMRVVNAVLVAALLAFAFALLFRLVPPVVAGFGFLAVLTPMTLFLAGAVNPNALEIAAAIALVSGLASVCLGPNAVPPRAVLVGIGVAAALLANARAISPLWMAVLCLAVVVMTPTSRLRALVRQRAVVITLAAGAVGTAAALTWIATTGTLGALGVFEGAGTTSPAEAFLSMLVQRGADPGIIALFGWVDTPAPTFVYAIWSALLASVIVAGLALARGVKLVGLVIAASGALLGPAIAQAASITTSGYIWQGRYSIAPLAVVALLAIVVIATRETPAWAGPTAVRMATIVGGLVVLGHVASMAAAITRYATVGAPTFSGLFSGEWSPPGGSMPWLALLGLGVGMIVAIWIAAIIASRASADERLRAGAPGDELLKHLG